MVKEGEGVRGKRGRERGKRGTETENEGKREK